MKLSAWTRNFVATAVADRSRAAELLRVVETAGGGGSIGGLTIGGVDCGPTALSLPGGGLGSVQYHAAGGVLDGFGNWDAAGSVLTVPGSLFLPVGPVRTDLSSLTGAGGFGYVGTHTNHPFKVYVNNTPVATWSTTGGAVSLVGNLTAAGTILAGTFQTTGSGAGYVVTRRDATFAPTWQFYDGAGDALRLYNYTTSGEALVIAAADNAAYFSGAVNTPAATATAAGLRLPHGTAPTSPVNGDLWTTTSSVYARVNGATVDLAAGSGSGGGMAIGGPVTGGTAGRVLFAGTGGVLADDGALQWNATTHQLGVGVAGSMPFLPVDLRGSTNCVGIDIGNAVGNEWLRFTASGFGYTYGNLSIDAYTMVWRSQVNFAFNAGLSSLGGTGLGCTTFGYNAAIGTVPYQVGISPQTAGQMGLMIRGVASQTAPLLALQGVSSTPQVRDMATVNATWADATDASRKGKLSLSVSDASGTDKVGLTIASNGTTADVVIPGSLTVGGARSPNAQTGTTYTLASTDANQTVTLANAAAVTLTVPPDSAVAFAIGMVVNLAQTGAGQVTVAPGSGVTINSYQAKLKLAGQYAGATLLKTGTDAWLLVGNIA